MTIQPPPYFAQIAGDDGKITSQWNIFFDSLFQGDQGTAWTPNIVGLTSSGTPTVSGYYYKQGALTYFRVIIAPAVSTTSTSGTTYIDNFPVQIVASGSCTAVTAAPSASLGMVDAGSQRVYFPSWSAITSPIIITGLVEGS